MGLSDRIRIPFHGLEPRSHRLSWSQTYMWDFLSRMRPFEGLYNLSIDLRLPVAISVEQAVRIIGNLVHSHEALRTSYYADGSRPPRQEVAGVGHLDVGLVEESCFDSWFDANRNASFRRDAPPLQFVVSRRDKSVRRLTLIASHLAMDGWGIAVIQQEVLRYMSDAASPVRRARQPVDQATWEASSAGTSRNRAGIDYWQKTIEVAPAGCFKPLLSLSKSRFCRAEVSSVAAGRAVLALAREHGAPQAAIVLTAYLRAVTAVFGYSRVVFWVVAHNRFDRELREAVGCFFRDTVVSLESLPDEPSRAVRLVASSLLRALRYTQTDARKIDQLLLNADRGSYFDLIRGFYYNFTAGSALASGNRKEEQSREIKWSAEKEFDTQVTYLNSDLQGDSLILRMLIDTWCVPMDLVEKILTHCLEDLIDGLPARKLLG